MEKTYDKIKKGLECCKQSFAFKECGSRCPYYREKCCGVKLYGDASDAIQQLETERHRLFTAVKQLQQERDAALAQLRGHCWCCKKGKPLRKGSNLMICPHFSALQGIVGTMRSDCPHWEWNEGKENGQ